MFKTILPGFIAVVLAIVFVGCRGNSVNTISNAGVRAKITRINDLRVETDRSLARSLCLTELRESRTNDGYMRVQVYLKNLTDSSIPMVYRFNWYDSDGAEVENPDNDVWTKRIVVAGDDCTLTSVAPKKSCGDFKVRIKALD